MQQNTNARPEELEKKIVNEITADMANGNTTEPNQVNVFGSNWFTISSYYLDKHILHEFCDISVRSPF